MKYYLENHLEKLGIIYFYGMRLLKDNGPYVPDFGWNENRAYIFDTYAEAKRARDAWGGTSRICKIKE